MVEDELRRLAEVGLGSFPLASLPGLIDSCRAVGEQTSDSRFLLVASALEPIDGASAECDEESGQGLPNEMLADLDSALVESLPRVLGEADPDRAIELALDMIERVTEAMLQHAGWQDRLRDEQWGPGWRTGGSIPE